MVVVDVVVIVVEVVDSLDLLYKPNPSPMAIPATTIIIAIPIIIFKPKIMVGYHISNSIDNVL